MFYPVFGSHAILRIPVLKNVRSVPAEDFHEWTVDPKITFISGHLRMRQLIAHPHFRDMHKERRYIFSVLRDPIDRAISLFNYLHRGQPDFPGGDHFLKWTKWLPEDGLYNFLASDSLDPYELAETQFLYTLENLERGVREAVSVVRPKFDISKIEVRRDNIADHTVNPRAIRRDQISEEGLDNIRQRSQKDFALYEFVRRRELERLSKDKSGG